MKKIVKRIAESLDIVFSCDICEKEKHRTYVCKMCRKDVCCDCGAAYDSDCLDRGDFHGDYPDFVCYSCWKKGDKYIEKIKELRSNFETKEAELFDLWRKDCNEK